MKQLWELRQPERSTAARLSRQLGLHALTAKLLNNRSIYLLEDAQRFLKPSFKDLPPPDVLEDMDTATARIVRAVEHKENILVFGDYDVDGITATTLLYRFLNDAGACVSYYIPHRLTEGYGLKTRHITACALDRKVTLIITVDCGSSSHEAILEARRHGIDVIVTDHHEMPGNLPRAIAVINPKRKDNAEGLDYLAGVGVAFYLIINVRLELRKMGFWHTQKEPNLRSYCDLVALGTVADVTPMIRENRILTKAGLEVLQSTDNGALQTLMDLCGIDKRYVGAMDIAFKLAPRLNAAGRVAHADAAMALLTADNPAAAARQAGLLSALNQKRQEMENALLQEIDAYLDQDPSRSQTHIICSMAAGGTWAYWGSSPRGW
jgi:single-stranded-DNA-specific exonuclease